MQAETCAGGKTSQEESFSRTECKFSADALCDVIFFQKAVKVLKTEL